MPEIKLTRLPERAPVKLAITVSPELAADLAFYADLYRKRYDREEPITELIPAMLESFLASDRGFTSARKISRQE